MAARSSRSLWFYCPALSAQRSTHLTSKSTVRFASFTRGIRRRYFRADSLLPPANSAAKPAPAGIDGFPPLLGSGRLVTPESHLESPLLRSNTRTRTATDATGFNGCPADRSVFNLPQPTPSRKFCCWECLRSKCLHRNWLGRRRKPFSILRKARYGKPSQVSYIRSGRCRRQTDTGVKKLDSLANTRQHIDPQLASLRHDRRSRLPFIRTIAVG